MNKILGIWAKSISIGLFSLLTIPIILNLLSTLSGLLPAKSGSKVIDSSIVYDRLNPQIYPDIHLKSEDIEVIYSVASEQFKEINPYSEIATIFSVPERTLVFWIVVLLTALVCFGATVIIPNNRRYSELSKQLLVVTGILGISLPLVFYSIKATWDESFAFVSQAANFSKYGIWGISTTGPHAFSESSADWLLTIVAGIFLKAAPNLNGETAVIGAILIIELALAYWAIFLLNKYLKISSTLAAVFTGCLFLLFPQTLLTTSANLPTGAAGAGLAILVLGFLSSITTKNLKPFVISAIISSAIRWEYGLIAILSAIALFIAIFIEKKKISPKSFALLSLPGLFFVATSAMRFLLFGAIGPSGAIYKNQGIDGAYISSGFRHLSETVATNYWPLVLGFGISLSLLVLGRKSLKIAYLLGATIAVIPLSNSVIAGGDWFDISYARYTIPSLISISILTFVAIQKAEMKIDSKQFFTWTLFCVLIISQIPSGYLLRGNISSNPPNGRVNCLAEGGFIVGGILPPGVGIATAEVNTVAYFAKQPLTDLSGLVDNRVATQPLTPMSEGDPHHRKTLPSIIQDDQPGAIYLYEGSDCGGTSDEEIDAWNLLMNRDITRFRAGSPEYLFSKYQPTTFVTPDGHFHRYLVRRDLIG